MIFESVQGLVASIKSNPTLAPFLLPALAYVGFVARNIPAKAIAAVKRSLIVRITFGDEFSGPSRTVFRNFNEWFEETSWGKRSRSITITQEDQEQSIVPGTGTHVFFHNWRPFWFVRERSTSNSARGSNNLITLMTIGRSQAPIRRLIETVSPPPKDNTIKVMRWDYGDWDDVKSIEKTTLEQLVLNDNTRKQIDDAFGKFVNNPQWYRANTVPHKLCALFYGVPGTGKTSLIRAIACEYGLNLLTIDLSDMSNESLARAFQTAPKNSIILMEDIDASTSVTITREKTDDDSDAPAPKYVLEGKKTLTLAGILNALDGVVPLDGLAICITTNYPERLDAALLRKSRIDYHFEITPLEPAKVAEYARRRYGPDIDIDATTLKAMKGCDLHGAFLEHSDDYQGFLKEITK